MSLFPAYSDQAKTEDKSKPNNNNEEWLQNSSFQVELTKVNTPTDTENEPKPSTSRKKRKKKQKSSHSKKVNVTADSSPIVEENEYFKIELLGASELLSVPFIARPSAPTYNVKYKILPPIYKNNLKKRFKRYHKYNNISSVDCDEIITSENINKVGFPSKDDNFSGFKEEEQLSTQTGFYNSHLSENPKDIKMWLEYISFQDTVHQFEKNFRKGSIAKAQRVLAERKLSILEKALSLNPECEVLHRERLKVAVTTFPSDELQVYLRDLVEKDKGNIILWQGYIEATQSSMAHCNTPSVLNLYTKCLSTLHQLRRSTSVERHLLEECILKMLYQCGLFLKQAGLFEHLWILLRSYLELNLSPSDKTKFVIPSTFNETQLVELEDIIFTSNLPLHELWLRTEKLRESCHWLPYSDDEKLEDPQRLVLTEDVAELIHPITMPENIFKLIATIFSILKIPLIPCRHVTMGDLGLDYVPWNLDSVESLLSVYLPPYSLEISKNLWDYNRLAVGPQYLKKIPGHEEYLNFILKLMENCTTCLTGDDKEATTVWFFRFQRLLIVLDKIKLFNMDDTLKKRIKKSFKDFLKKEEHRQNEIYYLEYALVEYEFGNTETCINIINSALKLNKTLNITSDNIDRSQKVWCCLYKHLIQLKIKNSKDDILKLICAMVLVKNNFELSSDILKEVEVKLETISKELLQSLLIQNTPKLTCSQHFLPDFFTDWIICNGWFLYFYKQPNDCFTFIADIIQSLEDSEYYSSSWQKEVLYEFYLSVLLLDDSAINSVKLLDEVVFAAIESYPNNIFMLSVLEKEQNAINSLGLKWWRVQSLLLKSDRAISALFAVIIVDQQIKQFQDIVIDTITGTRYNVNSSLKNKMMSLFKKITSGTNTRKCGLIWRLYLQFVYTYFSPEICRNVYYSAVEECPWLKALYMDAAIYIPAELAQIQDLIVEKQLRLHVTPEELDVLRS